MVVYGVAIPTALLLTFTELSRDWVYVVYGAGFILAGLLLSVTWVRKGEIES